MLGYDTPEVTLPWRDARQSLCNLRLTLKSCKKRMNDNDTIRDVIGINTIAGVQPPPQPGESSSLPDAGSPVAEPDYTAG